MILVFILQNTINGFTNEFLLSEQAIKKPWQFLTAIFLHNDIGHLFYNLIALLFFGVTLEKTVGTKIFIKIFLISGIFANFISFWFFPNSLGASGAIMGIIGAITIMKPEMPAFVFGMIVPIFIASIIWITGDLLGLFGIGKSNIGYLAHLSGIFIGIIYGIYLKPNFKKMKNEKINIPEEIVQEWENNFIK